MDDDDCALGHSWEVFSGDTLNCVFCPATATAVMDEGEEGDE